MNDKIVIGMSGGVDSSTSAYILKNLGYDVYGVTLSFNPEARNEDFEDAKEICKKLDIPHKIIDMSKEFQKDVIDYFIDEYNHGMTPSPCIICDEKVKFFLLNKIAEEIGAKFIATGHYAKVEFSKKFNLPLLKIAEDKRKDQSYMLYRLNNNIIPKLLFPLSDYNKEEVRNIAYNLGVKVHDKKDSQGICFAKEGYIDFLTKALSSDIKEGDFIFGDGTIIGKHKGFQLYTIGQRRGLGLTLPRAYFITNINPQTNEITLGEYDELMRDTVELIDTCFNVNPIDLFELELVGKPRFSSSGLKGKLFSIIDKNSNIEKYYFKYNAITPQNAPGQHLALYFEDFVVGGGKIVF